MNDGEKVYIRKHDIKLYYKYSSITLSVFVAALSLYIIESGNKLAGCVVIFIVVYSMAVVTWFSYCAFKNKNVSRIRIRHPY